MMERLAAAQNAHDAELMASMFAEDYASSQPVHPGRTFAGRAQVLENWTAVFRGVPDFAATLVDASTTGGTEWGEWDWTGHHTDGSPFAMRGVIVLEVRGGLVAAGRLYMEPVDASGDDIEAAVRDLYHPPEH